mmetsp:Transcript_6971/g.20918  ORF Transcript_6971/g.20918 Transcript_6971/m.20918 type:complete len:289 (+) Transcript_6971:96-962(+)
MSCARGRLTMAPIFWMHRLAAFEAHLMLLSVPHPRTNPTAKAAVKQSPAPVVSTTWSTLTASCLTTSGSPPSTADTMADPLAPSLIRTLPTPRESSRRAASRVSCSVEVGIPVSRESSVSFGLSTARFFRTSLPSGASTPPASRMTGTPCLAAIAATSAFTASGISLWSNTAPAPAMALSSSPPRLHPFWFAPPKITIEFSPEGCKKMYADPVPHPSTIFNPPTSRTPLSSNAFLKKSPFASFPHCPMKCVSWPSLEAAAAWFAPFPPGKRSSSEAETVSPGAGRRST